MRTEERPLYRIFITVNGAGMEDWDIRAESAYEAAEEALRDLEQHGWEPDRVTAVNAGNDDDWFIWEV